MSIKIKIRSVSALVAVFALAILLTTLRPASAQIAEPTLFRIGERLSYNLSYGQFKDAGYAETYVVSRGKIGGKDSVEIRTKIKTIGPVSASFVLLDENRTIFASPDSGLPLFVRRTLNNGPIPKEYVLNFLTDPSTNFDLFTLIYKMREAGGTGSYTFFQGEQVYTADFQSGNSRRLRTDAGNFDTVVVMVHSEFLSTHGIRDFRIYLSDDNAKLPVLVRFKSQKAEFQATLAAVAVDQPDPGPDPTLSPTPVPTPTTAPSPRATPSPRPYVENEPLLAELGFDLGEKLTYRVSVANQPLATVAFEAVERKLFQQRDSLLLTATVTGVDRQNPMFRPGDTLRAQIDPVTLAPRWVEGKFGPGLAGLNQTVTFDTKTGAIAFGGPKGVDAPIGTHSLLTLMYAMRSFNLSASKNPGNPVNDTRVAVFWESKPYVFTLRPSEPADLNFDGEKISAQLITINTGNPQLDALGIKVWLSASTRVPLRFAVGQYQADLISIPKAAF